MSGWCAEHKREKPYKLCKEANSFMQKLMQMPDEKRSSIFALVWFTLLEEEDD